MIIPYNNAKPVLHPSVYVDETALVIGDVEIGEGSSVWFNTIVRGDVNYIRIGQGTNLQDMCMIHVTKDEWPTFIGSQVTLGHRVTVHGATIEDGCLIGMGSIILDGAVIGQGSMIGAGAVVSPGTKIPPASLAVGLPAKVVREVRDKDRKMFENPLKQYTRLVGDYRSRNINK